MRTHRHCGVLSTWSVATAIDLFKEKEHGIPKLKTCQVDKPPFDKSLVYPWLIQVGTGSIRIHHDNYQRPKWAKSSNLVDVR